MHHKIVIKVMAGDAEEGESLVRDALEDSIQPEHNTTGWDYIDDVVLITKEKLQSIFQVSSYKELEAKKKQEQKDDMAGLIATLRDDVLPLIAPLFMTKADAPLLLNTGNEELKKQVEAILKTKKDVKRPETFESIMDAFMKVLVAIAKKDTGRSMAMWRMEQIKKMEYCFTELQPYNTLQSTANHYAELPCEDKKGLHPYYFFCDRHL